MITLANRSLSVSVIDPEADQGLLGTRYCTGGSIFQVEDAERGNLLSGPTFPRSYNVADGQGAPDAFQPHLPVEPDGAGASPVALGIGIGLIDTRANAVRERCAWKVTREGTSIRFRAAQAAAGWMFTIERTLSLLGRTLRAETRIANAGRHLPFQWYPHPFFPPSASGECCRFNVPVTMPENPGYELLDNGFLSMKGLPWKQEDHFQLLDHPGDRPLVVVQKHQLTSLVVASCDYVPTRLPVWANQNTFSFEPYYERMLQPREQARWSITYDF